MGLHLLSVVSDNTLDEVEVVAGCGFSVIYGTEWSLRVDLSVHSHSFEGFQIGGGLMWFGVTWCHRKAPVNGTALELLLVWETRGSSSAKKFSLSALK